MLLDVVLEVEFALTLGHRAVGTHNPVQVKSGIIQLEEGLLHFLVGLGGCVQLSGLFEVGFLDTEFLVLHQSIFVFQILYNILALII